MIIPLTKMWFIVDAYSDSRLTHESCFAEYDFISKKIIWKQWSKESEQKNMGQVEKILSMAPIFSPLVILGIVGFLSNYSETLASPQARLGAFAFWAPFVLGVFMFFSFEYGMLYIRRHQKIIKNPKIEEQIDYFESIFENTIRHNNAVGAYKTPYLVNIVAFSFVFAVIALVFWMYNMEWTTGTFIAQLFVLSFLLSLVPSLMWTVVYKTVLMRRIIKSLKEQLSEAISTCP